MTQVDDMSRSLAVFDQNTSLEQLINCDPCGEDWQGAADAIEAAGGTVAQMDMDDDL